MTLQMSDTVVDRVVRVKRTIDAQSDPGALQVAVDGPCSNPDCDACVSTTVRSGSHSVSCGACGSTFQL